MKWFLFIDLCFWQIVSEANPNNNLMTRRPGLPHMREIVWKSWLWRNEQASIGDLMVGHITRYDIYASHIPKAEVIGNDDVGGCNEKDLSKPQFPFFPEVKLIHFPHFPFSLFQGFIWWFGEHPLLVRKHQTPEKNVWKRHQVGFMIMMKKHKQWSVRFSEVEDFIFAPNFRSGLYPEVAFHHSPILLQ